MHKLLYLKQIATPKTVRSYQQSSDHLEPEVDVYPVSLDPKLSLAFGRVTAIIGDEQLDRIKASADLIRLAIRAKLIIDDNLHSKVQNVVFFHIIGL